MVNHRTDNGELALRLTLLSLEGIVLSNGINDNDDATNSGNQRIVTARAGFRSSLPTQERMRVPSSHYCSLFDENNNNKEDGCLIAVCSEEAKVENRENNSGACSPLEVHWHGRDPLAGESTIQNKGWQCATHDEEVPHLEMKLPSQPGIDLAQGSVIEILICVVCTSSAENDHNSCIDNGKDLGEDDDGDSLTIEGDFCPEQLHICHAIAHLKLDDAVSTNADSGSICNNDRERGRVVVLPVRAKPPSSQHNSNNNPVVKLANNSMLSAKVERIHIPSNQNHTKEQHHYIESEWRGEQNAPASVIVNDSIVPSVKKNNEASGLNKLFRHFSTVTMGPSTKPTQLPVKPPSNNEKQQKDQMVGKIIEALEYRCPSTKDDNGSPVRGSSFEKRQTSIREAVAAAAASGNDDCGICANSICEHRLRKKPALSRKSSKQPKTSTPTGSQQPCKKKPLSQKISEKFFCGATLGDALKTVADAGHHCDEDHVGLYVLDTDSLDSSIATADVMGF